MTPQKAGADNLELPFSTPTPAAAKPGDARLHQLSKSRFTAGKQCHKLLWLKVHEPLAVELQPDKVLQDRFNQGAEVGRLAREQFPGGTLIDLPHNAYAAKVEATRKAMDAGAPSIYEASFIADSVFVACDVLLRQADGSWRLIEVKSSKSAKDEHLMDAAIQLYVLQLAGLTINRVEIMHLNAECRYPELGNLLARTDVTADVRALLPGIPEEIRAQIAMLAGELPAIDIGLHCSQPYDCPFQERCWPKDEDHISRLYLVGRKTRCADYMNVGVHRIGDIPPKKKLSDPAKRQIRSMKEKRMIVEDGLGAALEPLNRRVGFLDFETIMRAIPVWPGMAPWDMEPAQFSYHEMDDNHPNELKHYEFLAEGPDDPREALAELMIEATRDAEVVLSYSSFESVRIKKLQESVPDLRDELAALGAKLFDLHPLLKDYVYHPKFEGSFSLKNVLPALVPELSYDDLVIMDGMVASVEIARLLFVVGRVRSDEKDALRKHLLEYCKTDTLAMVKLLQRLRGLAKGDDDPQLYPALQVVR
jgi:predicted RecB family nuclease